MFSAGDVTHRLALAIFAGAFGSAFQHGYNTGVLNEIQNVTTEWIRNCNVTGKEEQCDHGLVETTFIWAWIVSIFCLGGMFGGLSVGIASSSLGRKWALVASNVLVLIAGFLMGSAKLFGLYTLLVVGRFVIGVNAGLAAGLTPMYLSEISPASVRGAVGTVYQLVITWSILLSQILGIRSLLGTSEHWPYLLTATMIPGLIQVMLLPWCPESPKHLYLDKNREEDAAKALMWLRNRVDVNDEMQVLREEKEANTEKSTFADLFKKPQLRRPLVIAVMMMLAQQLSGINAIVFYSTGVFINAGLSPDSAQYATIGMGVANVAMTIMSISLIERAGRKTLLLLGIGGMLASTVGLLACLLLTNHDDGENHDQKVSDDMVTSDSSMVLSMFSVFSVMTFVIFFAIGPGPIPWFFVSELFSQGSRPAATSIAVGINWSANFIVSWAFQPLSQALGSYVFVIFILMQFFFLLYIYYFVPETKDKTIAEITALFKD